MPRPLLFALLGVYLLALALIAFWPVPVDRGMESTLWEVIGWARFNGFPWVDYPFVQGLANVIMFLPFGMLMAALFGPGRRWYAVLTCLAVSVGIEAGQALFLPERYADLGDILTNTTGGSLGVGIVTAVSALVWRTRQRSEPVAAKLDA